MPSASDAGLEDALLEDRTRFRATAGSGDDAPEAWNLVLHMVGTGQTGDDDTVPDFGPEQLTSFALTTGINVIYPYARECVQSTVGRTRYPAFTLDAITSLSVDDLDEMIEVEPAGAS